MKSTIERAIGRLLRGRRAGDQHLICVSTGAPLGEVIALASDAFAEGGVIPLRYAGPGVGENVSPPLSWRGVPGEAKELVIVVEDPDAPLRRPFVHLIASGISPRTSAFAEGTLNGGGISTQYRLGLTSFRQHGYSGPRPLPGHGPHRYVFQLLALREPSGLAERATRRDVLDAVGGKLLAYGKLTGIHERA